MLYGSLEHNHKRAKKDMDDYQLQIHGGEETTEYSRDGNKMKYQVFIGEPSAEDIQQGALGDCYFYQH